MRRMSPSRESFGATTYDLDAHRRNRIAGLDEAASFAARPRQLGEAPVNLERVAPRRDLAAMQLIEAAEAAMRVASAPDDPGLWNARAFTISGLASAVLAETGPRARARGISLRGPAAADDGPQVVGEPHRLGQILAKLVMVALEARGVSSASLTWALQRQGPQMVCDITLRLDRDQGAAEAAAGLEIDEIAIDSALSLILPPEILAAAIGVAGPPRRLTATLRARLPLARVESAFAKPRVLSSFDETALNGLRILVVEDLDLNRDLLQMLLSPYGCRLIEASDGREALAAVDAEDFDVILMDLQLPRMDGFECMRRIRARNDARAAIPILAVSGRAMAADIAMAKAAGADGHLSKPYTSRDLVAAIVKCRQAAEQP